MEFPDRGLPRNYNTDDDNDDGKIVADALGCLLISEHRTHHLGIIGKCVDSHVDNIYPILRDFPHPLPLTLSPSFALALFPVTPMSIYQSLCHNVISKHFLFNSIQINLETGWKSGGSVSKLYVVPSLPIDYYHRALNLNVRTRELFADIIWDYFSTIFKSNFIHGRGKSSTPLSQSWKDNIDCTSKC